ncbi:MAG TPA: sulfotransferase [Nocardioidaceae bacterium]|nr:sulfotransferase [Nocardioidaceae bacterium]
MTAQNGRLKVLYLAGWQRSGSTILSNLLGQLPGFFSAGEIYYLWHNARKDTVLCGCGAPFDECRLWSDVMQRAFGTTGVDADRMWKLGVEGLRTRNIPRMALAKPRSRILDNLSEYSENVDKLYSAIAATTGCEVVVDSSKWPPYGLLLSERPALDVYVLHLVRDPRAVAHSWQRRNARPDRGGGAFANRTPSSSSARWFAWNAATEAFWGRDSGRYVLVRYEDFVAQPRETVRRVLDMIGKDSLDVDLTADGEVFLDVCHTVDGNPVRLQTGLVRLKKDDEWESAMDLRTKVAVTSMTLPLLLRYGYSLQPTFQGGASLVH